MKSGKQRVEGVEIGIQGEVTRNWLVYGGYAYLDGRIKQPISSGTAATPASVVPAGNKIGLVPENTFSLWNQFDLGGGWGTGLGLIYQDESFTSFNNTVTLPAFCAGRWRDLLHLRRRQDAAAAQRREPLRQEVLPDGGRRQQHQPGAPRNARLTLSMAF